METTIVFGIYSEYHHGILRVVKDFLFSEKGDQKNASPIFVLIIPGDCVYG
jgi:hypothetical protein